MRRLLYEASRRSALREVSDTLISMAKALKSEELPEPSAATRENVVFSGRIGEIVHITQPDGRVFEQFRRPPGTRLIIVSPEGKILITKEYRAETAGYDLRLPGGKVCDTLEEYNVLRANNNDMTQAVIAGGKKEALEEVGLKIKDPEIVAKAPAGATVEWDLYYLLVRRYIQHAHGQQLEHGEDIEITWLSPAEIKAAIADGQMQEWRSVGVLLGIVLPILEA